MSINSKWNKIKWTLHKHQTAAFVVLAILGTHFTQQILQKQSFWKTGTTELASRGTERVKINDVMVDIEWDYVRSTSSNREKYIITRVNLPAIDGKSQVIPDCGAACSSLKQIIESKLGFNTDMEYKSGDTAQRRQELFASSLKSYFNVSPSTSGPRSQALDEAKSSSFEAKGSTYRIREWVPASNDRLYARVSVEGETCMTCGELIAIPENVRTNATDILRVASELIEKNGRSARTTENDRERDREREHQRSLLSESEKDRRTGDDMLDQIIRDCQRENGRQLVDRSSSTSASRRAIRRDRDDDIDTGLGSKATDEITCRADKFRDLVSVDADNSKYISRQQASKFFERYIEPHLVRSLVNSRDGAERDNLFNIIHDLDSDISIKYSNVLNRITTLSEATIRTSNSRYIDKFLQAQAMAAVNPQAATIMQKLAQEEYRIAQISADRLKNTHAFGLTRNLEQNSDNLTRQRVMELFGDFSNKIAVPYQCTQIGLVAAVATPLCADEKTEANAQNTAALLNRSPVDRTVTAGVVGGRTAVLRTDSARGAAVRANTGFQPILPSQLTSYQGLRN